jgi:hypothetical protein
LPGWRHTIIEKYIVKPSKDHPSGDDDYNWSIALQIGFFVAMAVIILGI